MTQENMEKSRVNRFTSSGRPICTPHRYLNWAVPLKSELQGEEYGIETASIIGKIMCHLQ